MAFPIAKEGLIFVLPCIFLAFLFYVLGVYPLTGAAVFICLFFIFFFRNPSRPGVAASGEILSPADGKVIGVEDLDESEYLGERMKRVSIFMSVSNVHVNRAPCDGSIEKIEHRSGKFKLAFQEGIDVENERNYIVFKKNDERFLIVQIAGFLARRIVCYVKERDRVERGERVGLIAFGSRVDTYMPTCYTPLVEVGRQVRAGLTVLARKEAGNEEKKS